MGILEALILGIVEGITEFLPISSTAHLMFASELLGLAQSEFVKSFEIAIQSGAILAVVALYWRDFLNVPLLQKIVVAFLPTAAAGLLLYPFIKASLIGNIPVALGALALGGVFLIAFERWYKPSINTPLTALSYRNALIIGLVQSVAVIPGISRSAATIVGGLMLGLERKAIVEFSFLLAVPTMAAATGLDLVKSASLFSMNDFGILAVGFVASFVVALTSIKWILRYVQRHDFTAFGVYRIIAAGLFFWILL